MGKYKNIDLLLTELRSISGIASHVSGENDIEWSVDTQEVDDIDTVKRMVESKMSSAEQETLLGKAITLASRMDGVADFIKNSDRKSASIALAKIIDDSSAFLKSLSDNAKNANDEKTNNKKDKDNREGEEGNEGEEGDGSQSNFEKEKEKQAKKESIIIRGGFSDSERKDPFGYGDEFLAEVIGIINSSG